MRLSGVCQEGPGRVSWLPQWAITMAPSVRQEINVAVVWASVCVRVGLILRRMRINAWMYSV